LDPTLMETWPALDREREWVSSLLKGKRGEWVH
jgi:hypothetical protein